MRFKSISVMFIVIFSISFLTFSESSAESIPTVEEGEETFDENVEVKDEVDEDLHNEKVEKINETKADSEEDIDSDDEEMLKESQPKQDNEQNLEDDVNSVNEETEELQKNKVNNEAENSNASTKANLSSKSSALKLGVRDPRVIDLKKKLNAIGFGNIKVTNYFGSFTDKKVKEFQQYYGLAVDGSAGPATMNMLDKVYNSPFQKAKRHNETIKLKNKLNKLDFGYITVTNLYGSFTVKKVKEFQRFYGLKANGIADKRTLAKVDEIISSPLQVGERDNDLIAIKQKLNHLNYGKITVTNYFGDFTETNVKKFQRDNNLPVHGIIDDLTLDTINTVFNQSFQKGNRHSGVIDMKKKLNQLGFGYITVTTLYGSFTEKMVKEFQQAYGIKSTGIAGLETLNKLESLSSTPFQKGKRHKDTITLKENLNRLGFGDITVTNLYGSYTEKKVKEFQSYYGLRNNGIADQPTLNKIEELVSSQLQAGKRHDDLIDIKHKLNSLGYGHITVTTLFGSYTEKKVKEFQDDQGLPVSGIIDNHTLTSINEIFTSAFQHGGSHPSVKDLKRGLNKVGFGYITVTNLYGSFTKKQVSAFQRHYNLSVSGVADIQTFEKLNSILSSSYQKGKQHDGVTDVNKQLKILGYPGITVTNVYGSNTEKQVRQFQKDNGLPVSGIADEKTRDLLSEKAGSLELITSTQYDVTLNESLNKQMKQLQQTDKYRGKPAYVSANYVNITENHSINSNGVRIRTSTSLKNSNNVELTAKNGDRVTVLEEVKGDTYNGSTKWYKIKYKNNKKTLYVHSALVGSSKTAKVTANVNVRSDSNTSSHIYGKFSKGTVVTIVSEGKNWHQVKYSTWRNPTSSDLSYYLDPNNNDRYQHLVLSSGVNVPARELNKVLEGKGVLEGHGQAFIDGGDTHEVNELYLMSHAFLESGNGFSKLAKGVEVGKNKSGNLVLVTNSNRKQLTDIKTTYNMFGIGAVDSNPLNGGAIRAYEEGWFTPEAAIEGGAKFIGESYIHNDYKQNTLYKMRWNPANPGYPQYATDIGWAVKQTANIKKLYDLIESPTLHFDIPKYK